MLDYEKVIKEFKRYLERFDVNNEMMAMKISHSYHVANLANILAKRLELTEEEKNLAKTIGLLHDIGRFVQYEKEQMYSDVKTHIDHGKVAVDYLFKEGHIKDFEIPEKYYHLIAKAIYNHNKLEIEENLSEEELLFAKFLRDIDKIDIFRQQGTSIENWVYKEPINASVKKSFDEHHLVNMKDVKNDTEYTVSQIAYLFDIYFKESFELLEETDNLELFLSTIEVDKGLENEFDKIKMDIRTYLKERISD